MTDLKRCNMEMTDGGGVRICFGLHDKQVDCQWEYFVENAERDALAKQVRDLREALDDAKQSLETIARGAGNHEFMTDMMDVRGYAHSRALAARAVLAMSVPPQPGKEE